MTSDLATASRAYRQAARDDVRRNSLFYLLAAGLLIACGMAAILAPVVASAAFVMIVGWLLIISGVAQGLSLIRARNAPHFWLQLASVVLGVLLGILLLMNVGQGMVFLSVLLIAFFLMEGIAKIMFSLTIRPLANWLWVLASGVVGVFLSLWLWASMPLTSLWLVGFMVGLQFIGMGASLGALAWTVRKAS